MVLRRAVLADRWRRLRIAEQIAVVTLIVAVLTLIVAVLGVLVNAIVPVLVAHGDFNGSEAKRSRLTSPSTQFSNRSPSTQPSPSSLTAAWLDELSPVDGHATYTCVLSAGGRDIPHGVGFDAGPSPASRVSYDLGGHYATFEVDLAIGGVDYQFPAHFDVLGDGTSLLSGGVDVAPTSGLVHKSISVAGVRRLTLVATATDCCPLAIFGNPRIVP
jgi:hypothetical protein